MLKDCTFHHIGYAVKDIEKTAKYYISSGWQLGNIYADTIQNTYIAFLYREGFPLIELVAPIDETSPICSILKKVGNSTYHVCYSVLNIEAAIAELRIQRFIPLFKPVEAVAIDNRMICYLMHPDIGLIELVER